MKRRWQRALGLCCVLLLSSTPLGAQTYFASFTGTTVSSDGQPVADAEVVATNVQTQVTYTARSNSEGLYTISSLPIGTYKIRAQAQGFQAYETNEIPLESERSTSRVSAWIKRLLAR